MSVNGWIFITIAWGFIISLTIFSLSKVLKDDKNKK
jgi:hypothetical protein